MESIFTRQLEVKNKYAINTYKHHNKTLIMIESLIDGFCDYPIIYATGRIAFDYPERWPQYFKKELYKWVNSNKEKLN